MAPNGGSGTRSQDDEYFDGILIATVNAVTSPEKLKDLISSVEVPAEKIAQQHTESLPAVQDLDWLADVDSWAEGAEDGPVPAGADEAQFRALRKVLSLKELSNWNYDMFKARDVSRGHALLSVSTGALQHLGLFESCGIDRRKFHRWCLSVESVYNDCIYHNTTHAADVLHGCYAALQQTEHLSGLLSHDDMLALLLAAAVHDVGHPGVNNAFLGQEDHPLVQRYGSASVLEHFHANTGLALLEHPALALLAHMDDARRAAIRKTIETLILHTDMATHDAMLERLRVRISGRRANLRLSESAERPAKTVQVSSAEEPKLIKQRSVTEWVMLPEYESDGEEMPSPLTGVSGAAAKDPAAAAAADTEPLLAMQVLLHAADLSNVSKEWHIHVQWTHRVLSEFFSQGDLERHLGKQVSPHCVRDLRQGRTNQKQFLLKCVLPLYQLGMRAVPHGRQHFETCIGQMKLNAQRWEELGY